ncbi:glycosyltransferase family 2 protein [Frateuria soli]|uniref:glycosyltransferase family 2 protein n=1 Tax=Frateuria soli TaxID=1542730 RepID=UPI001E3EC547|nr:glycosyltransferase [Frateuria soli]UGB38982.1 glycosyltransferase [Frateuria soli]
MQVEYAPAVSVCVTTFQHAPFIRRCLESVLAQDFAGEIEVLVGDDGSADGTRDIIIDVASRDARVVPVFHSRNLGPTGNLESLVARAKGLAIAHLDGDDEWRPGKLRAQCVILERSPSVVAVYTNAELVAHDDRPLGIFNSGVPSRIDLSELLRRGNFLNHSSLLYRAEVRDAVLGIAPPWIDYRLHVRLAARGALAYVDQLLVVHRWRTPGSMIKTMPRAVIDGQIDAFREALDTGASAEAVRRAAGCVWGKALVQAFIARDFTDLRYFTDKIGAMPDLQAGFRWRIAQAALAPWRALRSVVSRKRGVYFP